MPLGDEVVDAEWIFVSIGFEGQAVEVGGLDLWQVDWVPTGRRITVAHPQHEHQRHLMSVYEAARAEPPVVFAAGEFSNGVWGFYVPE